MKSVIAFGVALGAAVLVGQSVETQLLQKNALSLEAPRKMVRAVEAEAERNYWHGAAAVVDDGGWLILLERINHAAMTASVELTTLFRITSRCTGAHRFLFSYAQGMPTQRQERMIGSRRKGRQSRRGLG